MNPEAHSHVAQTLKYSGLALPLIAIAVWLAGPHHLVTGPSVASSGFGKRLLIVHVLLASTIFLQGCRFQWFLHQKFAGWLLLGAGAIYGSAILVFVLGM
jgi:hypothetical protein